MIDLKSGLNFEQYMNKGTEEQKSKQQSQYEATALSSEALEQLRGLKTGINIIVFSEGYCPDCIVTIPYVVRMSEVNENIKVYFMARKGNEQLLEEYTGESRIPTVMIFDSEMQPKGVYIEFPEELKEKMSRLSIDEIKNTVNEYREGKFNYMIEKEILYKIVS